MTDRPEFEELVYFQAVKTQCESALYALEQFDKGIRQVTQPTKYDDRPTPNSEVFRALHSFLTHAGNISKLLFPISRKSFAKRRGEMLRARLNVDDTSSIADRSLRDALEHFDERLDRWARSAPRHFAIDNIHPRDMLPRFDPSTVLRTYLVDTREFFLMGQTFQIVPIVNELRRILGEVQKIPGVR